VAGVCQFLYLELEDTPLNRTVAIARKAQIEGDLATGNFDSTLKKYKPIVSNPTVLELWAKFTAFKATQCDPQTIEKYTALLGHLQNHFKSVSNISEQQAIKFAEYLESRISAAGVRERIGLLKACSAVSLIRYLRLGLLMSLWHNSYPQF
jgi:integrase